VVAVAVPYSTAVSKQCTYSITAINQHLVSDVMSAMVTRGDQNARTLQHAHDVGEVMRIHMGPGSSSTGINQCTYSIAVINQWIHMGPGSRRNTV
jgi:hypothetical protein